MPTRRGTRKGSRGQSDVSKKSSSKLKEGRMYPYTQSRRPVGILAGDGSRPRRSEKEGLESSQRERKLRGREL